jgi:hypothetical protein
MRFLDDQWHKATRSGSNGQCVEARYCQDLVEVRNSNHREAGTIRFTPTEWSTFIAAVTEDGEFRLP